MLTLIIWFVAIAIAIWCVMVLVGFAEDLFSKEPKKPELTEEEKERHSDW